MRLSTVVALSLLLALGLLVVSAAIDEQELIRPHSTWRAPILKIETPAPTPEGGWWESFPKPPPAVTGAPFVHATDHAVKQPTREARP
jgi:hypothetical protein